VIRGRAPLKRTTLHADTRLVFGRRLMSLVAVATSVALVAVAPASTTTTAVRVPSLRGTKLRLAEVLLRNAGLRVDREDCDCTFGVVIKSNWFVCMQWPGRGRIVPRGTRVRTYSVRDMIDC
jgi:beta-lactam-binding protein with PASTA domain